MKKTLTIVAVLTLLSLHSHASTILLTDDFTDGNVNGWTVKDGSGIPVDGSGGGTLTVQDDMSGIGDGNAMLLTTVSKTRFATVNLSQAITLGANDSITLTMDYRYVSGASNVNNTMSFRLINSSDNGYMGVGINPGSTAASSSWFQKDANVEGAKWANDFVHDLTAESVTFTISRTADDKAVYTISWAGGSTFTKTGSVATNPAADFTIDRLQIGFASITMGGFLMDNVTVSTTASLTENPEFSLGSTPAVQIAPAEEIALPVVILNNGFDATNVTATLTTTSSWFTVSTGTVETAVFPGNGAAITNGFGVVAANGTPAGTYTNALLLSVAGYGPDGSPGTLAAHLDITVLFTNEPAQYVSPNSTNILISGTQYINRETDSVWFQRHSDAVLAMTYPQNGFNDVKARADTGIMLTFKTDSDKIKMSFRMLDFNNRGAGYGIFENGTMIAEYDFVKDTNTPETVFTIESTTPGTASVFQITLPSWANVEFFDMRIDEGASMLPCELPVRKRYVALGDSITHGTGQQSYTHRTYPFKLAQALDVDLFNLAVGGSRVSVPTGEMLSEFPPIDVITILIGYNDCFGAVPLSTYQSNLTALVTACRTNQPNADIFCITPTYTSTPDLPDSATIADFRQAVADIVATGQTAGDTKLHLIRGETIITNSSQLLDGVHLLPDGAIDMANGLFTAMDPIVNAPAGGITHSHSNPLIDYDGVLFPKHTNDYVQLNRFSDAVLANPVGFNVDRALVPSCVVIRFTTPSPTITAHFGTLETEKALKMPQYAVYRNGTTNIADYEEFKFDGSVTNPVFTIVSDSPGTNVMYEILLPSMNATCFKGLTLENGYNLVPNAPYERPVFVAIGDSITMNAGFQSQSYETYTWKFGRARGMEVYNIAVGGAVTAPDWGSMFPALDPEFITVLFGINDWNTANDLAVFRTKYMQLLDNIRAGHPDTPLFCITLVAVNDTVNPIGANGVTVDAYRNEIIGMVNERRTAGDSNIYVINGHSLTRSGDLLDDFHFDSAGTSKFATNLNAAINQILVSSNYTGATAIPSGTFADWAAPYALNAAVTNYQNDADGDGLNNLVEYALGGNPVNGARAANALPGFRPAGTNGIEYVYQRRRNAAAHKLNYTVERCNGLSAASWNTNGCTETGSAPVNSDFESVTNRITGSTNNAGFVRLQISVMP